MKMNYLQDERRMVRGVWSSIAAFPSGSSAARRDRPHHLSLQALHSCAFSPESQGMAQLWCSTLAFLRLVTVLCS